MTIDYSIIIGHELTTQQKNTVEAVIKATFLETDRLYNKWNPQSELSLLNRSPAHSPIPLSPELESLLLTTNSIVELTQGRFDPTIEPLQQLWKTCFNQNREPSPQELSLIIPSIGWHHIQIDHHTFTKDHDLVSLDLGGIAKGYCVDLLVKRIKDQGFDNIFVEWGGEISTRGQHPEGRPWRIFISAFGDSDPDHALSTLNLKDQAIATSGDYLQNWKINQTTYYHIIDPFQLKPRQIQQTAPASVSVLASSCAFADGLATAAMMFSTVQEAEAWATQLKNCYSDSELEFWIVARESPFQP